MKICLLVAALVVSHFAHAQKQYTIDIANVVSTPIRALDLGGVNGKGDTISANNEYITLNGKPFFPIMGEFHFSRYPNAYWEESILKMKAGGINVIATYVFWNLHEPKENVFDWAGDRDLRKFIQICAKHQMYVIVRVGPYGHGEIRNGAIPDWLYGMPIDIRTDNKIYLNIISRYYTQIGQQLKGLLFKDGGYVIGTQLENEYQHAGSIWSLNYAGAPLQYSFPHSQQALTKANTWNLAYKEQYKIMGDQHMQSLKRIAIASGLVTPLYTATGWGYAAIVDKGSLPVTAAYAYPSWGEIEASPFYLFKDIKRNPDYGPARYNGNDYPSLSAEMGSGIMIVYGKRPKVPANSITPMMVRAIGSGSNGIGYYMYHGGSTPVQDGKFMSEELSGLPKISYDFQAPIGEFGQLRESYFDLIPLHLFLSHFGSSLAKFAVTLPETNPSVATNADTLRYSVRSNGSSGFVFFNTYQDHADTKEQYFNLTVNTAHSRVHFTDVRLKADKWAIFPFNMEIAKDLKIVSANALPLGSVVRNGKTIHLFMKYDGIDPQIKINYKERQQILHASKDMNAFSIEILSEIEAKQLNQHLHAVKPVQYVELNGEEISVERPDSAHVVVKMQKGALTNFNDIFLKIHYTGDFGQAFLDGELVADQFFYGDVWQIGLKRFAEKMQRGKPLYLYFHPILKNAPYLSYFQQQPDFKNGDQLLNIGRIQIIGEQLSR